MADNFWNKLLDKKEAILALAPMAGFTNSAFRHLCSQQGANVLYSEMASAAAIYFAKQDKVSGINDTMKIIGNNWQDRHYVVQLFGSDPKHFALAAKVIEEETDASGIDINFGCPVPKVTKQTAGAKLMQELKLAREIVEAVLENTQLPLSIKIRSASGSISAYEFIDNLKDLPISALMIHGRSLLQGFQGEADHNVAKELKDIFKGVILVNGGINDFEQAHKALELSQAHGLGLARGALSRPWLFQEIKEGREINKSEEEIFKLMIEHVNLFLEDQGEDHFVELRKHLVWYAQGMYGAKFLRENLVKVNSLSDVEGVIKKYLEKYGVNNRGDK